MRNRTFRAALPALIAAAAFAAGAAAQQVADPDADISVAEPAYVAGVGPRVVIDGAHNNFHTVDGRYEPFAQLLGNDGFRVAGSEADFSAESLAAVDLLVIANPVADENVESWDLPNPSAFEADEIAALRTWVEAGGGLLLIADHMPFAGAAADLGAAFGVRFDNGYAMSGDGAPDLFTRGNGGLADDPLAAGVEQVRTFTGSAFAIDAEGARPLLLLSARYDVLMPEVAYDFSAETPRVSGEGRLQAAVLEVGAGRVAVFGEAAMFTAQLAGPDRTPFGLGAPGAEGNKALVLNVVRWLASGEDR
jgi:hypothetical protein